MEVLLQLKAEGGGATLDPLVDHARTGDGDAFDEIRLVVAARLDARRAGVQCAAAAHEVAHEDGHFQPSRDAAVGNGETDRGQLVVDAVREDDDQFSALFSHVDLLEVDASGIANAVPAPMPSTDACGIDKSPLQQLPPPCAKSYGPCPFGYGESAGAAQP